MKLAIGVPFWSALTRSRPIWVAAELSARPKTAGVRAWVRVRIAIASPISLARLLKRRIGEPQRGDGSTGTVSVDSAEQACARPRRRSPVSARWARTWRHRQQPRRPAQHEK